MSRFPAFRYFAAVSPPSPPLVAVLALLAAGSAVLEALERGSSDWVLASIALLQIFASATGFTRHASRGHYDPVLLAGGRSARVALAHFAVSAAPGAAGWITAGIAQAAAAQSPWVPAFRPEGWATVLLVSAVPWAASIRMPPLLPGALWLFASGALIASGRIFERFTVLRVDPSWASRHPVEALAVGLAFPLAIPSFSWAPAVLIGFGLVSLAALAAGAVAIATAEFPLVEEGS